MVPPAPSGPTATTASEPIRVPKRAERSARTSEVVAHSIRSQIARGELKAGDRFPPEDELMEVFGIARTTLREALRILESEGLVTVLRGRNGGPRVTAPTIGHISRVFSLLLQTEGAPVMDVHSALAVIEPQLAGQLAKRRDPRALAEIKAAIENAAAVAGDEDGAAFGVAAAAVHEKIFEHGGNVSLAIFAKVLQDVITKFYRNSSRGISVAERRRAIRSYRKFYKLVEAGEAEAVQAHWQLLMTYPERRAKELLNLYA